MDLNFLKTHFTEPFILSIASTELRANKEKVNVPSLVFRSTQPSDERIVSILKRRDRSGKIFSDNTSCVEYTVYETPEHLREVKQNVAKHIFGNDVGLNFSNDSVRLDNVYGRNYNQRSVHYDTGLKLKFLSNGSSNVTGSVLLTGCMYDFPIIVANNINDMFPSAFMIRYIKASGSLVCNALNHVNFSQFDGDPAALFANFTTNNIGASFVIDSNHINEDFKHFQYYSLQRTLVPASCTESVKYFGNRTIKERVVQNYANWIVDYKETKPSRIKSIKFQNEVDYYVINETKFLIDDLSLLLLRFNATRFYEEILSQLLYVDGFKINVGDLATIKDNFSYDVVDHITKSKPYPVIEVSELNTKQKVITVLGNKGKHIKLFASRFNFVKK